MSDTPKSKKKLFIIGGVILVVCLVAAGIIGYNAMGANNALAKAQASVDELFTDSAHSELSYLDSEDTTAAAKLFDQAKSDVANVKDNAKRSELEALIKRAEGYWSDQLDAHSKVTELYEDGVPCLDCMTDEGIDAAQSAIDKVSNNKARSKLEERLALAKAEFDLHTDIKTAIDKLTAGSLDDVGQTDLDEKIGKLVNEDAKTAYTASVQKIKDDAAAKAAAEAAKAAASGGSSSSGGGSKGGSGGSKSGGGGSSSGGGSGSGSGGGYEWRCSCGKSWGSNQSAVEAHHKSIMNDPTFEGYHNYWGIPK